MELECKDIFYLLYFNKGGALMNKKNNVEISQTLAKFKDENSENINEVHSQNLKKLVDIIVEPYSVLKNSFFQTYENYKMESFLSGILAGKWPEEELKKKVTRFGDKELLVDIIYNQLKSQRKELNVICGLIVKEALNRGFITDEEINHLEFLLSLNMNDFKNYMHVVKHEIMQRNLEDISKMHEISKTLTLLETTHRKMTNFGYAEGTLDKTNGIVFNSSLSFKLFKILEQYPDFLSNKTGFENIRYIFN